MMLCTVSILVASGKQLTYSYTTVHVNYYYTRIYYMHVQSRLSALLSYEQLKRSAAEFF